jgi:hypothetical protein
MGRADPRSGRQDGKIKEPPAVAVYPIAVIRDSETGYYGRRRRICENTKLINAPGAVALVKSRRSCATPRPA